MEKIVLKIGILLLLLGGMMPIYAQEKPELKGTWVLDSLQMWKDNSIQSTVFTGEQQRFENVRLSQFVLGDNNKASYIDGNGTFSDIPYSVNPSDANYTLIINSKPDIKTYNVTFLSENKLLLTHSFSSGFSQSPTVFSWRFYYSKKN